MRERTTEHYFCNKIKEFGGMALKLVLFCGAGFPDRTVIFPNGHIFFVEFKTETGKFSKLQIFWQKKLSEYGFRFYVCRNRKEAELTAKAEYARCYS